MSAGVASLPGDRSWRMPTGPPIGSAGRFSAGSHIGVASSTVVSRHGAEIRKDFNKNTRRHPTSSRPAELQPGTSRSEIVIRIRLVPPSAAVWQAWSPALLHETLLLRGEEEPD